MKGKSDRAFTLGFIAGLNGWSSDQPYRTATLAKEWARGIAEGKRARERRAMEFKRLGSTVWCAKCDAHHLTSELPNACPKSITPTKGGFVVRRKECQTCGEPPFGDEYTCACKVH